jgi:hypothetical protein
MTELPGLVQHTINQIRDPAVRQAVRLLAEWERDTNVALRGEFLGTIQNIHQELVEAVDANTEDATYNYNLGAPDLADPDFLVESVAMKNGAYTLEDVEIDVPRNITATRTVVGDPDTPGKILVVGTDAEGEPLEEEITPGDHGVLVEGGMAFATVESVTGSGWAKVGEDGTDTIEIGVGNYIGLPVALEEEEDFLLALFDGAIATPDDVRVSDPPSVGGTAIDLNSETYDGSAEILVLVRKPVI